MSLNRENVVWQSPDGTWNRGFYDYHHGDTSDPDYDEEWDVNYDYDRFHWVSSGHRTEDAARASWNGANPGSDGAIVYIPEHVVWIDQYEDLAARLCEDGDGYYMGPKRTRTLKAMQAELNELEREQARFDANKYLNNNRPDIAVLSKRIAERAKTATPEERAGWLQALETGKAALTERKGQLAEELRYFRPSRFGGPRETKFDEIPLLDGLIEKVDKQIQSAKRKPRAASPKPAAKTAATKKTVAKKTGAKKTAPVKKATPKRSTGKQVREGDLGVPSVNKGRYAETKNDEPNVTTGLDIPF